MAGQTPKGALPREVIYYGGGDVLEIEIADFGSTDISTWDFKCDVYQNDDVVETLSSSNGDFTVTGDSKEILKLSLSSTQTSSTFPVDAQDTPTEYVGIVRAENAGLSIDPYRFLVIELVPQDYDGEH